MESYRSVHQVYQRRARKRVDDNAEKNIGYSEPCVSVTPAEPKPVQVYARKQWRVKRRLRVDSADSSAMNILGEKIEVSLSGERGQGSNGTVLLKFSVATDEALPKSENDGQEEAGDGAGVADLLEAFSAEDAALTGISFTELLSSTYVNAESFSMERESAASDGGHDNQKEQADKDDATCCTSFGPNEANRTMGCISTEHPLAPSTPLHGRYVHKIDRVDIDLNKTPRQKPKKKKKKHVTPKVATERKPVRIPKPKTRENGSCARKRKYVSRKDAVEGSSTPSIEESSKKNLRRKGLMHTPITLTEYAVNKYHKGLVGEVADSNLGLRETSCKRYLNFDDGRLLQDMKSKVQSRLITRSQCLITSRKVGPNFPEKCKQRRKARLGKTMHVDFPCFPINFKKRRSARSCRANMFMLCSSISEFVHEKQRKQRKFRKKKMQVKSTHSIHKEFLDHNDVSACNFLATKGQEEDLQSRELEDIIQKLMRLNIEDEVGTLVQYKPKPKTPKVLLDEETITAFNQLMMSERADGDSCGEMDWQNDEKWEKERNKFREWVENFISKMHLILGDRKFLSWKGSVVDSVVGVFLTQNVSDNLSSSAFMSLCAKFPKACVNNRECSKPLVSDTGSISSKDKDVKVIKIELNESSNLIEEKRCVQNMPTLCEMSMKNTDVKNVQVEVKTPTSREKKKSMSQKEKKKVDPAEWEKLRKMYSTETRNENHMDSLDWEAVRCAKLEELAETIKERGQNNIIASRIQDFLSGLVRLHNGIDLEWLRNCPTNKVKDYLLEVDGLGLKSVECVRLLSLQHMAFPVDTNVGRIAVRLGWVPLQPLPDNLPLHQLERYPQMDDIQKYLWPRLCTLDQRTLYELHYHLITFGKVFCTKRSPNCNACPLRDNCKHFASAFASAFPLPATPHDESRVTSVVPIENTSSNLTSSLIGEFDSWLESNNQTTNCEPIIEVPPSPEPETCNPPLKDIEDLCLDSDGNGDDDSAIPTIKLNSSEFLANLCSFMSENNMPIQENSTALVALTASDASIPLPKLKYVSRLRTVHYVYKLPDDHLALRSLEGRDPNDQCPYLLAAWPTDSSETSETGCKSQISGECCNEEGCSSCRTRRDHASETIKGTILIPCRTAMRGSFPLNGTYFQVNEVFADDESSRHPIDIPRSSLWNLPRRLTYFGTSTNTIFRGLSTGEIQNCFWRGFICVRGIDLKTGAPRPLSTRFHRSVSKQGKGFVYDDQ